MEFFPTHSTSTYYRNGLSNHIGPSFRHLIYLPFGGLRNSLRRRQSYRCRVCTIPMANPQHLTRISIIFVHGLRGHRLNTWTKQGICWPKDLLAKEPALSNVRILSFGYDSRIVVLGGQASLNSLFKHSMGLLNGLCRERVDTVGL